MKVAIASDHAGYKMKEVIKEFLNQKGFEIEDFGSFSEESVDYPDTIKLASKAVSKGEADRGVVLCSSGIGASIVANKIKGIRAALCLDEYSAEYSRRHNDANVLALAAQRTPEKLMLKILEIWLSTDFDGGRHQRRIEKITEIERGETGIEN